MTYISATETAKLVRAELKRAFPGQKFSVKQTPGGAIRVSWVDGPNSDKVKKVAGHFHGSEFDGMQDLKYSNRQPYANDFIFFQREFSPEVVKSAAEKFAQETGWQFTYEVCSGGVYVSDAAEGRDTIDIQRSINEIIRA